MWEKLNEEKNISKGDNWSKFSRWQLLYKIREEKDELIEAIMAHKSDEEVIGEIADVANYLAMLLDNIKSRQENGDSR
jgi:phosphoribosyl-ATP pyrophosphohydrolase